MTVCNINPVIVIALSAAVSTILVYALHMLTRKKGKSSFLNNLFKILIFIFLFGMLFIFFGFFSPWLCNFP